ncbi:MAG: hypothetical protein WAT48_04365, partial [Gemmiger qucibialis]
CQAGRFVWLCSSARGIPPLFYKLHGFCISKCKVAGGVCQAPVFLRKIVDVKVCEIYPAGLEKQV